MMKPIRIEARGDAQKPEPRKISVVDSWSSSLDLIDLNGWSFQIRQTTHLSDRGVDRVQVTTLHLNRVEGEALLRRLKEMLQP